MLILIWLFFYFLNTTLLFSLFGLHFFSLFVEFTSILWDSIRDKCMRSGMQNPVSMSGSVGASAPLTSGWERWTLQLTSLSKPWGIFFIAVVFSLMYISSYQSFLGALGFPCLSKLFGIPFCVPLCGVCPCLCFSPSFGDGTCQLISQGKAARCQPVNSTSSIIVLKSCSAEE